MRPDSNKITRRWAKRGSRPSAPRRDQRTASTSHLRSGLPAGAAMGARFDPRPPATPRATATCTSWSIAKTVAPGAHAVLMRRSGRLAHVDAPRSCRPTSPSSPCRQNPPSSTPSRKRLAVYARQLALQPRLRNPPTISSDRCCDAWNKLVELPFEVPSCPSDCRSASPPLMLINETGIRARQPTGGLLPY